MRARGAERLGRKVDAATGDGLDGLHQLRDRCRLEDVAVRAIAYRSRQEEGRLVGAHEQHGSGRIHVGQPARQVQPVGFGPEHHVTDDHVRRSVEDDRHGLIDVVGDADHVHPGSGQR